MDSSFSISPAELCDVSILNDLQERAMAEDMQTLFKQQAKDPNTSDDGTRPPIASWVTNPKLQVQKAVDSSNGSIIGFIVWAKRGFDEATRASQQGREKTSYSAAEPAKPAQDAVDRLNQITSADFESWMEATMPEGTKCMFICCFAVEPKAQGRGVGKALIRHGLEEADREKVFSWVHASEGAYPMFEKEGYETDKALCIDLDEYAKDVQPGRLLKESWGTYTLRYMIRRPRR